MHRKVIIFAFVLLLTIQANSSHSQDYCDTVSVLDWGINDEIAVGYMCGRVEILDNNAELLSEIETNTESWVAAVLWSPDGTRLAYGAGDNDVSFFDRETEQISSPEQYEAWLHDLTWNSDGSRLASTVQLGHGPASHNRIVIWDTETGANITVIEASTSDDYLYSVDWNPLGSNQLATGGLAGTIFLWDVQTGQYLAFYSITNPPDFDPDEDAPDSIKVIAWSPDGSTLAAGTRGGQVWLWNTETWESTSYFLDQTVNDIDWTQDSRRLAIANGSRLQILDVENGSLQIAHEFDHGTVALAWNPSGEQLAYALLPSEVVHILDVEDDAAATPIATNEAQP